MNLKDKLQIILVTYNRSKYAKRTLDLFLNASPVKDCDLLVLDNNSTDDTGQVVAEFQKSHGNLSYIKNKYNVGLSGNIARAMELADKEYVWIIGDDDVYDFSHWDEAEAAMMRGEKLICIARYALPEGHEREIPHQLFQLTFITGGIYHTSLFNDVTMRNTYDNLYTLFPHLFPIVAFINSGSQVCVLPHPVSDNGLPAEPKDCSYIRGLKNSPELSLRTRDTLWILGYANVLALLKDKALIRACLDAALTHPDIMPSKTAFYLYLRDLRRHRKNFFHEIYDLLAPSRKMAFWLFLIGRNLRLVSKK